MRTRPDGRRRLLFAYLSIGEAESYRYYWRDDWAKARPEWLEPENPDWPGNYLVRYWHPEWHGILYGSPNAYLDRILDAGFDGIYIDGADKFEQWKRRWPTAAADMADLIAGMAGYARGVRKDFLVIAQNGDGLLGNPKFLRTIDGFAREDLLYGEKEPEARNSQRSITDTVHSCVGWWRRGCRSSWSNTPPVQTARRRCCARSGSSGSSATSPPATSNRSHRPPSDADSRIVRNEGEIVEPVQRPRQRKIGDQRGDRRRRQEAQAQIGRSERQQRVSQRAVEYQEDRLQDAEHDTAVEIEHQRRAGDEQELEGGADQAEPQRSDLAILHVEKVDHDRRGQRDQRADDELRHRDGRDRCDGLVAQSPAVAADLGERGVLQDAGIEQPVIAEEPHFEMDHEGGIGRHHDQVGHEHRAVVERRMQQAVLNLDAVGRQPDHPLVDPGADRPEQPAERDRPVGDGGARQRARRRRDARHREREGGDDAREQSEQRDAEADVEAP